MPKRNYQFEKRQKDLEKKRKKEEKRQRKLDRAKSRTDEASAPAPLVGASGADAASAPLVTLDTGQKHGTIALTEGKTPRDGLPSPCGRGDRRYGAPYSQ